MVESGSTEALFTTVERHYNPTNVALSRDTGSSYTLQRLVGPARALELGLRLGRGADPILNTGRLHGFKYLE